MPTAIQEPASPQREESTPPATVAPYQISSAAAAHEDRNFLVLAAYQIVMRTGWIFKTESIVMPAVLDTLTGGGPLGGLLRGFLPVFNRLGHSIPPILYSRRLKVLPKKRNAMFVCTLCMATIFLALSTMWWFAGSQVHWWMPTFFLASYLAFFAATGVNNLSFGTLQGKLIVATRRGRLLQVANVVGAATAIAAVALLLPAWLTAAGGRFDMIFGFTAICFFIAAGLSLWIKEPEDDHQEQGRGVRHLFTSAWQIVRTDKNFRRLAWVAMAFGCSLMLFPHYQALGRSEPLGLSFDNIVTWLIVQNTGTALFSLVAGPIADRRGNRLVMQLVMAGIAGMPITAVALSHWPTWGPTLYPLVFLFIGLTPVGFKTLNNYTLEICPPAEHPRYLSTLGLCFAVPLLMSPAVGWIVEATNFETVFVTISCVLFVGWLLTFRLHEPRHALHHLAPPTVVPEQD